MLPIRNALGLNGKPGSFHRGVKRPVCEAKISRPSSAKVKTERRYTSAPLYAFMAWTRTTLPILHQVVSTSTTPSVT